MENDLSFKVEQSENGTTVLKIEKSYPNRTALIADVIETYGGIPAGLLKELNLPEELFEQPGEDINRPEGKR